MANDRQGDGEASGETWRRMVWKTLQYLPALLCEAEAKARFDEQIGKWMASGETPDLSDYVRMISDALAETHH